MTQWSAVLPRPPPIPRRGGLAELPVQRGILDGREAEAVDAARQLQGREAPQGRLGLPVERFPAMKNEFPWRTVGYIGLFRL